MEDRGFFLHHHVGIVSERPPSLLGVESSFPVIKAAGA
jgi:hypothetical protein